MTAPELDPEFRNLIDARLDAVERALLRVQVSYSERRHIVGEVETQIYELLARRSENPTREDVIAVLDSLDPPEAYIPEELRGRQAEATAESAPAKPRGPRLSKLAVGSALLVVLVLLVGIPFVAGGHARDAEVVAAFMGINLFLATLVGCAALVRILRSNGLLRGLPLALFATLAFPLLLINIAVVMLIVATHGVLPWMITVAGLVYLNYLGIRRLWQWFVQRHGKIAEALRGDLSAWFSPRNGIQPT